jgi:ribose transport system substrate-binding protein
MKKSLSLLVALMMVISIMLTGCGGSTTPANDQNSTKPTETTAVAKPEKPVHSNIDEFKVLEPAGTQVSLKDYYKQYGVDCLSRITATGGSVTVSGLPKKLPKPNKKYKIGLALYYTVDEVGAFVLEGTKKAAEEMGIELLVNDANYKQDVQNQAVEQWILEGVDGVILYPADFTACAPILKKLKDSKIPVMAGNPPLGDCDVDSVFILDNVEIGRQSAQFIIDALKAKGGEPKGKVALQTLPFLHPNAATREAGFMEVMNKYPGIQVLKLTGVSPEEHYTAFEGAMQANQDLVAGWGLYSSAVIGMSNARKAAKKDNIIIAGVDNDRPILAGIKKGEITGSVGYSAFNHAYWTLDNLVNLLNGAEVPALITGPIEVISKDNVDQLFKQYYGGRTLDDYMAGKQ